LDIVMEARSPYRSRIAEPVRPGTASQKRDHDLLPIGIILWLVAAGRVVVALLHHETFRADATLALIITALIPWLALSPMAQGWRGRGSVDPGSGRRGALPRARQPNA